MYHIASLSQPSIRSLMDLQNQGANHSRAFNVSMAYVIASKLALPAGGTEDLGGYYRMNHAIAVREAMSKINELIPFDMRSTEDMVKAFMQFRLNMVNMTDVPLAINPETSLVDFFTLSSCFSKDTLDTIQKEGSAITSLISRLGPIYKEISTCIGGVAGVTETDPLGERVPG